MLHLGRYVQFVPTTIIIARLLLLYYFSNKQYYFEKKTCQIALHHDINDVQQNTLIRRMQVVVACAQSMTFRRSPSVHVKSRMRPKQDQDETKTKSYENLVLPRLTAVLFTGRDSCDPKVGLRIVHGGVGLAPTRVIMPVARRGKERRVSFLLLSNRLESFNLIMHLSRISQ